MKKYDKLKGKRVKFIKLPKKNKKFGTSSSFFNAITAFSKMSQNEKEKINIKKSMIWKNKIKNILKFKYNALEQCKIL